jgi:hypothetical protein
MNFKKYTPKKLIDFLCQQLCSYTPGVTSPLLGCKVETDITNCSNKNMLP